MSCEVTSEYISVACSCTAHSLDWGPDDRLCFGAGRALALARPLPGADAGFRITHTLHHHSDDVVSCRWARALPSGRPVALAVTGSRDRSAAVWDLTADTPASPAACLRGHAGPITLVDAAEWEDGDGGRRLTCVTASGDCSLRLWEGAAPAALAPRQTLALGRGLALALRLALAPAAAAPWLLVGTDDAAVVVYAADPAGLYAPALRLAGHEDWVRCLDVVALGDRLLLASGGQDALVRVWSVAPEDRPDAEPADPGELRMRSQSLTTPGQAGGTRRFSVTLDSVLAGHEGWVLGLRWRPRPAAQPAADGTPPPLASAGMDRSLLVWERDPTAGLWVEAARLGAVGGSALGLLGCAWSPDGGRLAAHGQRGAFHFWAEAEAGLWRSAVPCGGHADVVADLAWAPAGGYLLTVSRDQTTRLHARWRPAGTWHELGRPQVHGHDLACVAAVSDAVFASGAEEKVARAFTMPSAVRDTLAALCGECAAPPPDAARPEGAAVPSLGLSNKPVSAGEAPRAAGDGHFVREELRAPPSEETLLQNTLWPEARKLYGHGFELAAMAASGDGRLLATSCRAARPEHASVLLWDTATWRQTQALAGAHQLTVVQLAFSPGDRFLLSVSRDRTWSVYERQPPAEYGQGSAAAAAEYRLSARGERAHSRIIWCCAWLGPEGFVTGSRDGQLLRWRRAEDGSWRRQGEPYRPGAAVTAAAAAAEAEAADGAGLVAVGLETGEIRLLSWSEERGWAERAALDTNAAHHGAVRRLQFQPGRQGGATDLLASCGADHAVKLHRVTADGAVPK